MKARSTKKALLASLLSLVVCVSLLVGSTFAWFTDSVTSAQNVIQSGNLDVELYYTYDAAVAADPDSNAWVKVGSTTDVFGYNLWEPGFTKVAYFKVVNEGSLALKYKLSADVYEEVEGKNQAGEKFLLSDHIKTALVPVGATRDQILAMEGTNLKASFGMSAEHLTAKGTATATKVVGMALWMPTTVGNEANHNGTDVPKITFGINLIATQDTVESDSFGSDYDTEAVYPNIAFPSIVTANQKIDDTTTRYDIPLYAPYLNDEGEFAKQGSVVVPKDAVDPNAEEIEIVIKKLSVADSSVPVGNTEKATTLDITVEGIKEGNTALIEVTTNIGAGLGNIKLYHKNVQIPYKSYNNDNGTLIFETTSFSPFTIVYTGKEPVYTDTAVPHANVTNITGDYANAEWGTGDLVWSDVSSMVGAQPMSNDQALDCVFKFVAPHDQSNIGDCAYKDYACDYYVMLKSDTISKLPANYITLGGNYEGFGWVGFTNPEVAANEAIPLLGSVAQSPWSYEMIANGVSTFLCGVGVNSEEANEVLKDAEFIVMLRLADKEGNYVNVNTIVYNFATKAVTMSESSDFYAPDSVE